MSRPHIFDSDTVASSFPDAGVIYLLTYRQRETVVQLAFDSRERAMMSGVAIAYACADDLLRITYDDATHRDVLYVTNTTVSITIEEVLMTYDRPLGVPPSVAQSGLVCHACGANAPHHFANCTAASELNPFVPAVRRTDIHLEGR